MSTTPTKPRRSRRPLRRNLPPMQAANPSPAQAANVAPAQAPEVLSQADRDVLVRVQRVLKKNDW